MLDIRIDDEPISKSEIHSQTIDAQDAINSFSKKILRRSRLVSILSIFSIIIIYVINYFSPSINIYNLLACTVIGLVVGLLIGGLFSTNDAPVQVTNSYYVSGTLFTIFLSIAGAEFILNGALPLLVIVLSSLLYGVANLPSIKKADRYTQNLLEFEYADSKDCLKIESLLKNEDISNFRNKVVKEGRKFLKVEVNKMLLIFKEIEEQQKIDKAYKGVYLKGMIN